MNKKQLTMLENVFGAEIDGQVYPSKSKVAKQLEEDGYIVLTKKFLGRDRFGEMVAEGYVTTVKGNYEYCQSCK